MYHSTSEGYKPIVSRSLTSEGMGVAVPEAAAWPRIAEVAAVCLVATDGIVAVDVLLVLAGDDPGNCCWPARGRITPASSRSCS